MRRPIWIYLMFAVAGAVTIACSISDLRHVLDSQVDPVPLPDTFIGENIELVENTWRLVEITHRGEVIEFEAIAPITFSFMREGYFGYRTTDCNAVGYKVITKSEQRYRLIPRSSTQIDCGELGNAQLSD